MYIVCCGHLHVIFYIKNYFCWKIKVSIICQFSVKLRLKMDLFLNKLKWFCMLLEGRTDKGQTAISCEFTVKIINMNRHCAEISHAFLFFQELWPQWNHDIILKLTHVTLIIQIFKAKNDKLDPERCWVHPSLLLLMAVLGVQSLWIRLRSSQQITVRKTERKWLSENQRQAKILSLSHWDEVPQSNILILFSGYIKYQDWTMFFNSGQP